jgi:hypothetical protein
MRIIEITIVVVIATLALSWVGPLGWALIGSAWRYTF